jgi:hypothetical protein
VRKASRKTGRPISFDKNAALESAMLLFWERGLKIFRYSGMIPFFKYRV